ncbi:acireductone dioxygenase [Frankia sp. AgB32]|uniref:1,2-dihydroxy-3-keto-5-methylthiopentene dioxygenase n=1 Tax=Frankia sp. AgB32 TaxID=631119 RepID=UPI00200D55FA|nr:cupin [Frankia sp. AgB32]MCK9895082.1 cupin [Frankia sp. AgB32]
MTLMQIIPDGGGRAALSTSDPVRISLELAAQNVHFERWRVQRPVGLAPDGKEILDAYRAEVDRLINEHRFRFVDVVRMVRGAGDPHRPSRVSEARQMFLEEHTHRDAEVRFFAEGKGCFYLHFGDHVYALVCEAGDLLSIPARVRHWFDMGSDPEFCAIRFFLNEDGWVGDFSGDPVSSRILSLDEIVA